MISSPGTRLALLVLALVGACASSPPQGAAESVTAAVGADGVQRAAIVGGAYWFKPSHVSVKANRPVELAVSKAPGLVPHSFVIDAPQAGIKVDVELAAEPRTVRFVPTQPGRYAYYCDKSLLGDGHREKGMAGVLEVTAQ
jgi:plastocyanin